MVEPLALLRLLFPWLVATVGPGAALVGQQQQPIEAAATAAATAVAMPPGDQLQRREALAQRIAAAKVAEFPEGGLCGAVGGARVKLLGKKAAVVQLPIPQRTPSQQPVVFTITAEPPDAVTAFRLRQDGAGADFVEAALQGKVGQEVRFDWAAVVLLVDRPQLDTAAAAAPFLRASPCAQSDDAKIAALAERLWPAERTVRDAAQELQRFVCDQRQGKAPRSLDALGILASGANGICTANANLAVAVLRCRGLPARSLAVVPPTGQRLEMHRIVEWFADDQWHRFDPSGLAREVPMRPSQSVVMAVTGVADEERSMRPRLGVSLGCPYGQELEVLDGQVTPWGQDFFWTEARPLAAFAADAAGFAAARDAWARFLATGTVDAAAEHAAAATGPVEFAAAWGSR